MRFAICLLLNITLLAIITSNMCVKALTICDQMHKSSKTRFDYAFTMRTKDGDQHYIIIGGYGFQIHNHTDKALMIYDGTRSEKTDHSVLAFAYKEMGVWFHVHDVTCYYKVNIKEFVCHVDYNVGIDYKVKFDLFKCSSQPIDLKRVIAYHPQSYSDVARNEILLVERVVDQTDRNNQRKVWTSYWPNLPTIGMESTCVEENDYNESQIIPKFLNAINKSLEITGILPINYNREKSAIILFYVNESHKYCITTEAKLSSMCQSEMLLKDYLKYCDQNLTKTTISTYNNTTIEILNTLTQTSNANTKTTSTSLPLTSTLNYTTSSDAPNDYRIKILIFAILDVIAITVFVIQLLVLFYMLCVNRNKSLTYQSEPLTETITSFD